MRTTRLKLSNWGPHEHLDLDMDTGVFGLFGPNASGKTKILEAIEFGFTGLTELNQEAYLRKTSDGKQAPNGSVDLYFRKGGIEGRIFRQVGTSPRRELTWEGVKYKKVSDIDKLLGEILDCDKKAVGLAVFLNQGHIGDFLFQKGADREETFARMCLIDHLSMIPDIAAQLNLEISRRVTDLTSQRDEALIGKEEAKAAVGRAISELELHPDRNQGIQWFQNRLEIERQTFDELSSRQRQLGLVNQAKERLAQLQKPAVPEGFAGVAEYRDELKAQEAKAGAAAETLAETRRQLETRTNLEKNRKDCSERLGYLNGRIQDLISLRTTVADLTAKTQDIAAWRSAAQFRTTYQNRLNQAEELMKVLLDQRLVHRPVKAIRDEEEAIRRRMHDLSPIAFGLNLAQDLEQSHQQFDCCPLCKSRDLSQLPSGQALKDALAAVHGETQELNRRLEELAKERDTLVSLEGRITQGNSVVAERKAELDAQTDPATLAGAVIQADADAIAVALSSSKDSLVTLEREMGEMPGLQSNVERINGILATMVDAAGLEKKIELLTRDSAGLPALRESIAGVDQYLRLWTERTRELTDAEVSMEGFGTRIQALEKQATESDKNRPSGLLASDADVTLELLKQGLRDMQEKQAERERVQGSIKALTDAFRRAEHRVAEIEERVLGNARIQTVMGELDEIKNAFSRGGIPRHYLSQVFDSLVEGTQDNLAAWEEDFTVEKDPNKLFNFLFSRGNDPETLLDQSQLSGGQRTRLAISFLQAVQSIVLPEVNFMVLDEPSADLDESGIAGLGRLFEAMSRTMDDEAQVIVVTHHPALRVAMGKHRVLEKIG